MNQPSDLSHQLRFHSRIAVLINTIVGGIIGAAFGSLGNFLIWLIGGLTLGAVIGITNETLYQRAAFLKRWFKLRTVILVLVEVLLVMYVLIPLWGAYHDTHPVRVAIEGSPSDMGLTYEDAVFPTADGLTLRGWYIPSQNGAAIIALHGSNGNRVQTLLHAFVLAEHGYGVLLFDLRAHGESEGGFFPVTNDSEDVKAAVRYLRGRQDVDPERIGGVGLSLGAHVLLQAAAEEPAIKALISDGASHNKLDDLLPLPSEYRLMYAAAPMWWMMDRLTALTTGIQAQTFGILVERIAPRPILFISSSAEPEPFTNRRLFQRASHNSQLWELPDTEHVGGIFKHPQEYEQRMIDFFDEVLLVK